MLTTPYKVLIACSSLLLLAALGYRVTDLLGGGGASTPPRPAVVDAGTPDLEPPDPGTPTAARPDPLADLQPPTRRADAATADAGRVFGTMERLDPVVGVRSPADPDPDPEVDPEPAEADADAASAVPTLVIGRTPGEPRPDRRERGDDGEVVPGGTLVYVVQPGDTFEGIAQRTLGDANRWSRVAELNPGVDPLRMQVGDRLNLPPMAEVPEDAKPAVPRPSTTAAGVAADAATHEVQPGESLTVIALRYYGDSNRWKAIYDANRSAMKNPDDLAIGVELRIPPLDAPDR